MNRPDPRRVTVTLTIGWTDPTPLGLIGPAVTTLATCQECGAHLDGRAAQTVLEHARGHLPAEWPGCSYCGETGPHQPTCPWVAHGAPALDTGGGDGPTVSPIEKGSEQ